MRSTNCVFLINGKAVCVNYIEIVPVWRGACVVWCLCGVLPVWRGACVAWCLCGVLPVWRGLYGGYLFGLCGVELFSEYYL